MKFLSFLLIIIGVVCLIIGFIPQAAVGEFVMYRYNLPDKLRCDEGQIISTRTFGWGDYVTATGVPSRIEVKIWLSSILWGDDYDCPSESKLISVDILITAWGEPCGGFGSTCIVGGGSRQVMADRYTQTLSMDFDERGKTIYSGDWLSYEIRANFVDYYAQDFYVHTQVSNWGQPGSKADTTLFGVVGESPPPPPPEPHDCDEGYYWNGSECVLNPVVGDEHECDEGYHWNETLGECVEDVKLNGDGDKGWLSPFCLVSIFGIVLILIGVKTL